MITSPAQLQLLLDALETKVARLEHEVSELRKQTGIREIVCVNCATAHGALLRSPTATAVRAANCMYCGCDFGLSDARDWIWPNGKPRGLARERVEANRNRPL